MFSQRDKGTKDLISAKGVSNKKAPTTAEPDISITPMYSTSFADGQIRKPENNHVNKKEPGSVRFTRFLIKSILSPQLY
jgi:hypothetical protein